LLALAAVAVFGVYGAKQQNPDYDALASSAALALPGTCPPNLARGAQRAGAADGVLAALGDDVQFDADHFLQQSRTWLLVSSAGALALGLGFLVLVSRAPRFVVRVALLFQAGMCAAYGAALLSTGAVMGFVFGGLLLALSALLVYLVCRWPPQFETCSRLLGVAGYAIRENPGVALAAVLIKLTLLAALAGHIASAAVAARAGEPARYADVVEQGGVCVDARGATVDCCYWRYDSWVPPAWAVISLTALWSVFVAYDLKIYTVADSMAQWYYLPQGASTGGTTLRALGHAMGPGFGSVAFGAFVLTAVEIVRQAARNMRREAARQGGAAALLACLCECFIACVADIIEFLSKFALIEAAVTGLAFWQAGKQATAMLKRHFATSYTVWWLPPTVLNTTAFLASFAFGYTVYAVSAGAFQADSGDTRTTERAVLAALAGLMAMVVLGFFASLVLNAADTAFLLYTHDLEMSVVGKQEVHAVYAVVVPLVIAGAATAAPVGAV